MSWLEELDPLSSEDKKIEQTYFLMKSTLMWKLLTYISRALIGWYKKVSEAQFALFEEKTYSAWWLLRPIQRSLSTQRT